MAGSVCVWLFVCCVVLGDVTGTNAVLANGGETSYHVTLSVFSGTRDPIWILQAGSPGYEFLSKDLPDHSTPLASRLGYSGFTVKKYQGSQVLSTTTIGRCTNLLFEGELVNVIKSLTPHGQSVVLSPAVIDYVTDSIDDCEN